MTERRGRNRRDWKRGSVAGIGFSVIALIGTGSMGRKACENFPGIGMWLSVKSEGGAYINESVMPGQTDRQTDRRTRPSILDLFLRTRPLTVN